MKRFATWFGLSCLLALSACAPGHMVVKETKLDLKGLRPDEGKAALVVARTTSIGGAVSFETFLDREMVGVTKGKGYFVKRDVAPGTRYLIAKTESMETGKIVFEPGLVYFVQQTPRLGVFMARVTLSPVAPDHLFAEMDDGTSYMEYDGTGETLSEEDYKEAVADYEREVTEGHHKEFTAYKGFPAR